MTNPKFYAVAGGISLAVLLGVGVMYGASADKAEQMPEAASPVVTSPTVLNSAPELDVYVTGGGVDLGVHRGVEHMRSLTIVGTDLKAIELPRLSSVDVLTITDNESLTTLELPMLKTVGVLRIQGNPRLSVDFTITGTSEDVVVEGNAGLSSAYVGQ